MSTLFKTIALIGKSAGQGMDEVLSHLAVFLRQKGYTVLVGYNTTAPLDSHDLAAVALREIVERADLGVVLGGDGTMLSIARKLAVYSVPLVGINQGSLGFLTDVTTEDMFDSLSKILDGEFIEEERLLLKTTILRHNKTVFNSLALNDVVINKGATGRLIEFGLHIDGEFVYNQRSDGLVIATPTGSTAYALSAGGPILHPSLEAFVLVPICPHTLSARPIAVNSHAMVEFELIYADDASAHFDGQKHCKIHTGDVVQVTQSPTPVKLLHPKQYSYYRTLREKLYWGQIL
jgi:NAD+ kinase